MALTDENGGNGFYMPVAPAYGGGYGNNGGFFGGDWAWILLLLLIGGNGWGFGGGFGNGMMWPMMMGAGMGGYGIDYLYPWLNNSEHISDGFRDQQLQTSIGNLQNSVTSGFGDIQNSLCAGFAGVNATVNGGVNALAQQLYTNQIADLERSFAAQTANTQGMTTLQAQLAQCCCDNRLATAQTQALVQSENCTDRYEAAQNTAAIINAINGGIQAIKDDLCADRLDAERRENANLRSELMFARGQASQDVQTATIQAGQRALANEVEQYVLPTPRPAYIVQNPNCCQSFTGCGCGA